MSSRSGEVSFDAERFAFHDAVDLSCDRALEASFDLAGRLSLEGSPGGIGLGRFMDPETRERDRMKSPVELAITTAAEAESGDGSAGGWDRGRAAEGREGRFRADAPRVRPGDQELGCGDGPNSGPREKGGADPNHELFDLGLVFGGLRFQHERAAGGSPDGANRCAVFDRLGWTCPQPGATLQLLVGGAAAELVSQRLRRVHDQRFELPDGLGAADHGALPGGDEDPQCFAIAAGARCGKMVPAERFPGSPDRVEVV